MIIVQHGCGPALEFHERFGHVTQAWAKRHGLDYIFSSRQIVPDRSPHWEKPLLLEELLHTQNEDLLWIDGDAVPVKPEVDPRSGFKDWADLAMVADQSPTPYNTGVMFIRNNGAMRNFLRDVNETGPIPHMRYHDQARICERLPYHDIRVQMLDLRWNFAGCTNWCKMECEDPVIRAFHGWPKPKALYALSQIVEPSVEQRVDLFVQTLSQRLWKKLKVGGTSVLEVHSKLLEGVLSEVPFTFEVHNQKFELTKKGDCFFLWARTDFSLALLMQFERKEIEKDLCDAT